MPANQIGSAKIERVILPGGVRCAEEGNLDTSIIAVRLGQMADASIDNDDIAGRMEGPRLSIVNEVDDAN